MWTSWECYLGLSCFKEKEQSHRMLWTRWNQPRPVMNAFKFFTILLFCLGQATAHPFPVQPGQHQCGRQALPDWENENWLGLLCLWVFTTSQTLPDLRLVGTTQREYTFLIPTIIQVKPPKWVWGPRTFCPGIHATISLRASLGILPEEHSRWCIFNSRMAPSVEEVLLSSSTNQGASGSMYMQQWGREGTPTSLADQLTRPCQSIG